MLLFSITFAFAGWTQTAQEGGCTFFSGVPQGEVTPLRAECQWAIAPEKLQATIADFGKHDDYFATVEESTVLSPGLARQIHVASGISNRAVMIRFGSETIPGGMRFPWSKAPDQTGMEALGVVPSDDSGFWEVTSLPDGGSKVVYELHYGAGGSVPTFIVRWFQGSGFRQLVLEMKSWCEKH